MTFLQPWSAVAAGAVAVSILLLLYLLKLRRRRQRIPSTLLWQRSFEDLQANVPFQRLRTTPLFLLQLLSLLLVVGALAQPLLQTEADPAARVILLLDQSASMSTIEVAADGAAARTRLEEARDKAKDIVRRRGRGAANELMLVRFGAAARVVSGFESDRRVLFDVIDSVVATDEPADLQAALDLAGAFAGAGEDEEPPMVVLLSDGVLTQRDYRLRTGDFRFVRVGPEPGAPINNVGIIAFTARREYRDPVGVLVFARLLNAGSEPVETVATLFVDDRPASSRRVALPAATDAPGEATLTFSLEDRDGAVLRLQHDHRDQLPADDVAALVLPPPARPRIALVHPPGAPDAFLVELVEALGDSTSRPLTESALLALDPDDIDTGRRFDLIIFDRVSPSRLPGVPTLTVGGVPGSLRAEPPQSEGGRRLETWNRQHAIMRHVALDDLIYTGFGHFVVGGDDVVLASGPEGPVIMLRREAEVSHVAVGFALTQSNWPLQVSFVVFLQNVLDQLVPSASGQRGIGSRPGSPIPVRVAAGIEQLAIRGPWETAVIVPPGGRVTLPPLPFTGLYAAEGVLPPHDRLAVSLLSARETDIRPGRAVTVNASPIPSGGVGAAAPRPLWPWLAGLGLLMLVAEWFLYCRRLRF